MSFKILKLCVDIEGLKVGSGNFKGDLDEISKKKQKLESAKHLFFHPPFYIFFSSAMGQKLHLLGNYKDFFFFNSLTFSDFG